MKKMIADYMEKGFLENIVDMFRQDKNLYSLIADLLGDERGRVRLGTVALVETLHKEDRANLIAAIPSIASVLKGENPTIRGDAAYVLGIIGHSDALPFLEGALTDDHGLVIESAAEAINEIRSNLNGRED
jgi:HEAT repeat protein